jgi:hypothetical protein
MSSPHALKLGDKQTGKDGKYQYKNVNASRDPCRCQYKYAGVAKHKFYQFNTGSFQEHRSTSNLTQTLPVLNTMATLVDNAMISRFKLSKFDLPNYAIVNEYQTAGNAIGFHTDADPIFDATNKEAIVFSFNFHRSGMFAFRPMCPGDLAGYNMKFMQNYLQDRTGCSKPKQCKKWGA